MNKISDSHLLECARKAGRGAAAAERKKEKKYEKLLNNYFFVPIAIETFGSWGKAGLKLIKEIGRKITEKTGKKPLQVTLCKQYLCQSRGETLPAKWEHSVLKETWKNILTSLSPNPSPKISLLTCTIKCSSLYYSDFLL